MAASSKDTSVSITIKPLLTGLTSGESSSVPSLLGLQLSSFSPKGRFVVCSLAIFVFYLIYGYMLELVFQIEGMREQGWLVTLLQFCFYTLFALVQLKLSRETIRTSVPIATYCIIALLTVGTMGFSNSSMGYLNYPTQVIFKSCKLIPVMIGSVVLLNKRYSFVQVLACLLMCAGLVWFTLADSALQPNFDMWGVSLVSMSLCCDAIIGNVQEAALKSSQEPGARLVLYSYGIGLGVIALLLLGMGAGGSSAVFVYQNADQLVVPVLVMSCAGFCGVQAVLALVTLHGALAAVTVTTARKALSILISFVAFTKPFTIQYVWGGLLVCFGVYLNMAAKQRNSRLVEKLNGSYAIVNTCVRQGCHRVMERARCRPPTPPALTEAFHISGAELKLLPPDV